MPGDMATIEADGSIVLLGRGSVSINTGGEKVYPEEVEGVLKAHPGVYDVLVVGRARRAMGRAGHGGRAAHPRVRSPTVEELDAHCRGQIAGYKIPRTVVLVDQVVRSPSGKADYRWAKSTAASSWSESAAPHGRGAQRVTPPLSPRTDEITSSSTLTTSTIVASTLTWGGKLTRNALFTWIGKVMNSPLVKSVMM